MLEIEFSRQAVKALRHMQRAKAHEIATAIRRVAVDPRAPNNNLKPLKGVPGGFRIRVGDWRVSYTLDYNANRMRVFEIAPRGAAYR